MNGFALTGDFVWKYLFVMTIIGIIAMVANRTPRRGNSWKISELTLMLLALIGAAPGELIAMLLYRYKWDKRLFAVGIPLLTLVTAAAAVLLIKGI